jgi:hypothetical protein
VTLGEKAVEVERLEGQRFDVPEQGGFVNRRDEVGLISEPRGPSGFGREEVLLR